MEIKDVDCFQAESQDVTLSFDESSDFLWKTFLNIFESAVLALNINAPYIRKQLCQVSHQKI